MSQFQVVSLKPMAGTAKGSGRPYSMLIVTGILTNDDGTVEVGEIVFMESLSRGVKLPMHLQPGAKYTPVVSGSARQGKLQFEITELVPVEARSVPKAA